MPRFFIYSGADYTASLAAVRTPGATDEESGHGHETAVLGFTFRVNISFIPDG